MPLTERWTEVTRGLRHVVLGSHHFAPFTYRGMIEFLAKIQDKLNYLGDQLLERQQAANQLIYDLLIHPESTQNLPTSLAETIQLEQ